MSVRLMFNINMCIASSNPQKINEFNKKSVAPANALDNMGKFREIKIYVWLTLNKLPGIKSDLVRTDVKSNEEGKIHLDARTQQNPLGEVIAFQLHQYATPSIRM